MAKFKMGANDPLFNAEEIEQIKAQDRRPVEHDPDVDNYDRATFIVRKDLLVKFRDYCYTERLDQKAVINDALEAFLKDKKNLLSAPIKPKQKRR